MCGIAGVLNGRPRLSQEEHGPRIEAMLNSISHRGPDDSGVLVSDFAVLGHARLSIIDLEHGHQPMTTPDGRFRLVFNGEIYNYIELKAELSNRGIKFRTFSDTEVLLNLLVMDGVEALPKLNGMFAFCFVDTVTGDWIIARDHFGIKPCYLYPTKSDLYFASEIKAFLCLPGFRSDVANDSLNEYFTFQFCLGNKTLFKGVQKVEPGHFVVGRGASIQKLKCYWDVDFKVDNSHTQDYFADRLDSFLVDSARLQVRSDVPLGAYLSGGMDSSLVAALASGVLKRKLPLFTGRFSEGNEFDETSYAKDVADFIKGEMHQVTPSAQDFASFLPRIIGFMDEPLAGPGVFPQFMVSREASKYVKVILGGQGGDEVFGGYTRYLVAYLEQALKDKILGTNEEGSEALDFDTLVANLPQLKQYIPMLGGFWQQGLFESMDKRYFRLVDRSPDLAEILTPELMGQFSVEKVFEGFCEIFNRPKTDSYINKMQYFDLKTLLPALLHVEDRMSMASSIESRVPLLDYRIVELMSRVPVQQKFSTGESKSMLRHVSKNRLPQSVLRRKDKMGFPVPLNIWMKGGEVRDFIMDTLTRRSSLERGVYKKNVLQNIGKYNGVGARQLWGILSIELWFQTYIDQHEIPASNDQSFGSILDLT